jgi:hypothetical protein
LTTPYVPDPEQLGRRRFPDNKNFRKQLYNASINYLSQIQGLIPSNYPNDPSTNLSILNRVWARELARLNLSSNAINNDSQYSLTRPQFLQEILGERLLLGSQIAPSGYNDESYRNYLISIKNAYLIGSTISNLENLASEFTGQKINIRELYKEARDPGSSLDVTSANKMIVQVFVDDLLKKGYNINSLKTDLDFFIGLVRPAHVLYDTELIWTEQIDVNKIHDLIFGDLGGGCIPDYDYNLFDEPSLLALQVFVLPNSTGATGYIDSIHHDDLIFYFDDSTRIITEPDPNGTQFFDVNGRRGTFNTLEIGQYVRVNYQVIPGEFKFWYYPGLILPNWQSQFYRNVYRRPLFQETVKKVMDSHGRFPLQTKASPSTICDRWVQDTLQPVYEDLRGNCSGGTNPDSFKVTLSTRMSSPNFSWPYLHTEIYDDALFGSNFIHFTEYAPLTDGSSHPATISDISVTFDGTSLAQPLVGPATAADASTGRITINDATTYWDTTVGRLPSIGDEFIFSYHYLQDGSNFDATSSMVYGISHWQTPFIPLVGGDGTRSLADTTSIAFFVDGTSITNAVIDVDSLLGHVTLQSSGDFWRGSELHRLPAIGDTFEFDYFWGVRLQYGLLFDTPGRTLDGYVSSQQVYNILMDSSSETDFIPLDDPLQIGYRYRMYQLHHSSVLNSPDTLILNGYQKPAERASIINRQPALNHFNEVWSAEFLTDKNTPELNDAYLDNGLDPVVKLNYGTPTFQQTFAYQPGLIYQEKLQDIRKNHKLLMYSDLLLKQFYSGDSEVPLSSICDGEKVGFKVRIREEIPPIEECEPWILFDTADVTNTEIDIPGEYRGIPNLRIQDKKLRDNFILREMEPTGTAVFSYSTHTSSDTHQTTFQLPPSFKFPPLVPPPPGWAPPNETIIDFPALPVVDANGSYATIADITVTVGGDPWTITGLNPITGIVTIANMPLQEKLERIFTITPRMEQAKEIVLPGVPADAHLTTLTVIHGTAQYFGEDFYVYGSHLSWMGSPLDGLLSVGDQVRITYWFDPLVDVDVEFTYRIRSHQNVEVLDRDWSRIMDDKYVFPGYCPDIEDIQLGAKFDEFYGMLDDASDGIKISFLNTNSLQIEEHIFSGPLFEYYEVGQDQIGAPENFPGPLIRINNPMSINNPLNYNADFSFMNDKLVRFRKKTFKELLPNRTFRTMQLVEMLPV